MEKHLNATLLDISAQKFPFSLWNGGTVNLNGEHHMNSNTKSLVSRKKNQVYLSKQHFPRQFIPQ
jgi:hypothetical protein